MFRDPYAQKSVGAYVVHSRYSPCYVLGPRAAFAMLALSVLGRIFRNVVAPELEVFKSGNCPGSSSNINLSGSDNIAVKLAAPVKLYRIDSCYHTTICTESNVITPTSSTIPFIPSTIRTDLFTKALGPEPLLNTRHPLKLSS